MKKIILASIMIFLTSFHAQADADQSLMELKTAQTIIKALPNMDTYKVKGDDDPQMKAMSKAYKIIEDAAKAYLESPEDQLLLQELVVTASAINKKDGYQYAGELLVPVYKKQKANFEKALTKLSPADAKDLKRAVENAKHEMEHGNG